ncbi:Uncharacterized protein PECH_005044 [Penicillium ucsense]|uniref:CST complex subunit Ten1 n=1 Tax=Penicillium ucsense TaxID=2839758 RepID=A0A8J8WIT2_9EURO|nr:Uncharacterized protein PECM_005844 [Penicillium ucsense]KAF7736681.1 Uncharacterized protein PECH_005044 [Penicillium ucsense]
MNGPRPSIRVFLCDLPSLRTDTKVRFLGCVRNYHVSTGHLVLEHNYPWQKEGPQSVSVDVNAVLQDLSSEELRVGAWLNVIGYIRESASPTLSFTSSQLNSSQPHDAPEVASVPMRVAPRPVHVDAVMVFSAGAIALGEYERILRNAQDVERRMRVSG